MNNYKRRCLPRSSPVRQRGYVTLIVALVILVALTLITVYAGKVAVTELNTASNEARIKEAQAVAEHGLDRTVAYLDQNRAAITDGTIDWAACVDSTELPCG